jgi:hypothetical protein
MYVEKTIQKLSVEEMQILQSLIGRTIKIFKSDSINLNTNKQTYLFDNPTYIFIEESYRYIKIEYDFSETYYGDDFYTPKITQQYNFDPATNRTHIYLLPEFTIKKIEIYGIESELNAREIHWNPEMNYLERIEKGELPAHESISSESVFIFQSTDNRKMIICGFIHSFVKISFEEDEIAQGLKWINFENIEIKPKHILK